MRCCSSGCLERERQPAEADRRLTAKFARWAAAQPSPALRAPSPIGWEGRGEGGNLADPADHSVTMTNSILSEARANHARLEERNAVHRRFGFDPDASVRFVLEQALPLRGRVLDIGTGKGRFVIPMARHLAHVTTVVSKIHAAEGRRHPRPPSRFAHWRARLQHAGFAVRRVVACHEEVLVARRPTTPC